MDYVIREMNPREYPLLSDFLYEAIFQKDTDEPVPREIVYKPALQVYIKDFGTMPDDYCLCAETAGRIVGAVWVRNIEGYGSIDENTPEFAVSIYKEYRGQGIGTELMRRMLCLLREKGYRKASLSVQKENFAVKLYLQVGFRVIRETKEEYIMESVLDHFTDALLSEKTDKIPEEYDWFAPLLGDWEFEYHDSYDTGSERIVKGEWIFRRVLNGTGIEDLFICPSRETMYTNPQPDGEYGMAIRMFDPIQKCYQMSYACEKGITNLQFRKENDRLVGTVLDDSSQKWVFAEIGEDTFHWQNITILENGEQRVNSDVYARRIGSRSKKEKRPENKQK